jgi:8-hydroxy-5-deazaflavin:NADPH oxidoreductase
MTEKSQTIAILGGTGALGSGLAKRWLRAGRKVIIGSRTAEKAVEAVSVLKEEEQVEAVQAMANVDAAAAADIVVLTVPFSHQLSTLENVQEKLRGKVLIDVTVPLMPPKVGTVQMPEEGSAGARAQSFLGESVKVVSAFQNVAADHLQAGYDIDCDVLVSGNDKQARQQVIDLAASAGMHGWHAGPIANAAAAEALTSILIQINRQHKCHAGIRISGTDHIS